MHEFLISAAEREERKVEATMQKYIHRQVSKAAKHAVVFVVLRSMQRRRLNCDEA